MAWSNTESRKRVKASLEDCKSITIKDFKRDKDLSNIALTEAYRVNGVHIYVELLNTDDLLHSDRGEGERCHKRFLRLLEIYQRVAHLVFQETDAMKVDFQNQRLHALVFKPYKDERQRVADAVTIADLLMAVISDANGLHPELGDAKVRVGIDSGEALAVNNGTRGDREPLFLGKSANLAAKLLDGTKTGIFLENGARKAFDEGWELEKPKSKRLTDDQIKECTEASNVTITREKLLKKWKEVFEDTPISIFQFTRPTPPLKNLDLDALTPKNSRRLDAMTIVADIDGFTAFVDKCTNDGEEELLIRVLHAARKELRDVLNDLDGRKIRYEGDAVVGVLAEGTDKTDVEQSVSSAVLCAGAMRDAMEILRDEEEGAADLGIAIGLELGPVSITRLGVKGSRTRCIAGRNVLTAKGGQMKCSGKQTYLAEQALKRAVSDLTQLFTNNKATSLTYKKVAAALSAPNKEGVTKPTKQLKDGYVPPAIHVPKPHVQTR